VASFCKLPKAAIINRQADYSVSLEGVKAGCDLEARRRNSHIGRVKRRAILTWLERRVGLDLGGVRKVGSRVADVPA